jgi:predicted metal-dependent HD superfamily phosphohydrolase
MRNNVDKAIERGKELLIKADASHGLDHAERVLKYSLEIAKNHPEVDLDALVLACWWHDVGRIYGDKGHQKMSADMVEKELPNYDFDSQFIEKVSEAIVNHSSHAAVDPSNVEGKILKDADKLEYLTPTRWENSAKENFFHYFDPAIREIPGIRNKLLFFDESRIVYDKLLFDLKEYAKKKKAAGFQKYKDRIIALEPID